MNNFTSSLENNERIYTVSQLNREAKLVLENKFSSIWIEGELSSISRPSSGHIYFSLKDSQACMRCALFKNTNRLLDFLPKEGMQVLIRGKISLYEGRGDYQLIVESMEEAGKGVLKVAFEALKKQLLEEGLFDNKFKKILPPFIECVGIITSSQGAAIKDILTTLKRRFPLLKVIIYPTAVQGKEAQFEICKALATANQRQECQVLILARGGGSLEDLWAFNEENVARAIFASQIPIITGIGHEVDFTIADFVADYRAATPTAAAELVSPNQYDWLQRITAFENRLAQIINSFLAQHSQRIDYLERRLVDPRKRLADQKIQLNLLFKSIVQQQLSFLKHKQHEINHLTNKLNQHNPLNKIFNLTITENQLFQKLNYLIQQKIKNSTMELSKLATTLDAYSPLSTLNRGYAIVSNQKDNIVKKIEEVELNEKITTRLANGKIESRIEKIINNE